jgi:hypothetical protein
VEFVVAASGEEEEEEVWVLLAAIIIGRLLLRLVLLLPRLLRLLVTHISSSIANLRLLLLLLLLPNNNNNNNNNNTNPMHQENYPCRIQVVVLPRPVLDVVEGEEEEEDMRNNSMIPPRRVVVKMWNIMTRMKILGRGGNETMECQPLPRRVVRIKTEKQRRRRRRGVVVVVVRTWVTSNARQLWMKRILLLRIRTLPVHPWNKRVVAVEMDGNMIRSNDIIDESVNIHNSNIHSKEEKETMKSAIFQNDTIDEQKGIAESMTRRKKKKKKA